MRRITTILLCAAAIILLTSADKNKKANHQDGGYPITPVQFTSVKVSDGFWGQRLKASHYPPGFQQVRGDRPVRELRQGRPSERGI